MSQSNTQLVFPWLKRWNKTLLRKKLVGALWVTVGHCEAMVRCFSHGTIKSTQPGSNSSSKWKPCSLRLIPRAIHAFFKSRRMVGILYRMRSNPTSKSRLALSTSTSKSQYTNRHKICTAATLQICTAPVLRSFRWSSCNHHSPKPHSLQLVRGPLPQ